MKSVKIGIESASMAEYTGSDIQKLLEFMIGASARVEVASRRGVGRIRHIHTPTLWLHRAIHDGKVVVSKVQAILNPADLCDQTRGCQMHEVAIA